MIKQIMTALVTLLILAAAGQIGIGETRPSLLSQMDGTTQVVVLILLFGAVLYFWYAFWLGLARSKRTNIHYVSWDVVQRLEAQERGEDPPALPDAPPSKPINLKPVEEYAER